MSTQDIFFTVLKEKFPNLLSKICQKKYTLLVPLKKFITQNMLNQNFYDNHVFYVSPYDPDIYINFNGKSLIYKDSVFKSHLCWKDKIIEFKYKENVCAQMGDPFGSLNYIVIDNVCDEVFYNCGGPASSLSATEGKAMNVLRQFSSSDEYTKYYQEALKTNPDLRESDRRLAHFVNLMKNNYVFLKGQEAFYYGKFIDLLGPVLESFKQSLSKTKIEDNLLQAIVPELLESVLYIKYQMYDTIMGNLIKFSVEEEKFFSEKLKESKNDYNLAFLLGPQYKDCQFTGAIEKMNELFTLKTHYEKVRLINEINQMMTNEINEMCKKANSNSSKAHDNDALSCYWTFLLSQCNWTNLIAEINFMFQFNCFSNMMGGSVYLNTIVYSALDKIRKDIYKNEPPRFSLTQNIEQSTIITQPINPYKVTEYNPEKLA